MQDVFRSAEMVDWIVGGAVAGQVKAGGGLTFLAVEGAGHMVPMDQPANVRTPVNKIKNYYNNMTTIIIIIIITKRE